MPDVTVKRVEDFEAIFGGGFRRARAGLGVSSFGLAVIDLPPNFKHFPEHDQTPRRPGGGLHALSGRVTLRVGGEESRARAGVFARVGAAEKRKLITGDEPARVLAMGAMPGEAYEPPEFTEEGATPPSMDEARVQEAATPRRPSGRGPRRRAGAWRAAPGPSSAITRRPRPETIAPGTPESLSRTRSAAEASSSARAICGRRELAAAAGRACRASPRAARGRRSRSRRPPDPAARRARSCRRSRRPGRRPTPVRSRRESAARRRRRPRAAARRGPCSRLEESIPALAQTQPVLRLGDQDAALGAHDPPALREDELDQRGVLVELARPAPWRARPARRRPAGERAPRPSRRPSGRGPRSRRRAARRPQRSAAPSSVALAQLRHAGERPDPQLARGQAAAQAAACWARSPSCQSTLAVRGAGCGSSSSRSRSRREVLGGVEVDRQGLDPLEREALSRSPAPGHMPARSCPGRRRAGTGRAG